MNVLGTHLERVDWDVVTSGRWYDPETDRFCPIMQPMASGIREELGEKKTTAGKKPRMTQAMVNTVLWKIGLPHWAARMFAAHYDAGVSYDVGAKASVQEALLNVGKKAQVMESAPAAPGVKQCSGCYFMYTDPSEKHWDIWLGQECNQVPSEDHPLTTLFGGW